MPRVKAAIVVPAGTRSGDDPWRLTNALQAVKGFEDEGDDVVLIFDGAGTQRVPELEDEPHDAHALYESLEDEVQVGEICADAFHVGDTGGGRAPRNASPSSRVARACAISSPTSTRSSRSDPRHAVDDENWREESCRNPDST